MREAIMVSKPLGPGKSYPGYIVVKPGRYSRYEVRYLADKWNNEFVTGAGTLLTAKMYIWFDRKRRAKPQQVVLRVPE